VYAEYELNEKKNDCVLINTVYEKELVCNDTG